MQWQSHVSVADCALMCTSGMQASTSIKFRGCQELVQKDVDKFRWACRGAFTCLYGHVFIDNRFAYICHRWA
jgi:hypothetical protein